MTDVKNSKEYKKAKDVANNLRKESNAKKEEVAENKKLALVEVQGISVSEDVAEIYKDTSGAGMKNVSDGGLPQLKAIEAKSKATFLDGTKPKAGSLFYAPTKKAYDKVEVSIVTVSRGFWTPKVDMKGNQIIEDGNPKTRFNQIVGGVILETMEPFVTFSAGVRWKPMNDFVKSIKPFTKHKKRPIPLYAFRTSLETSFTETENYAIEYTLVKNDKNQATLVTDKVTIDLLLKAIDSLEEMIAGFIDNKEVDRYTGVLKSETRLVSLNEQEEAPIEVDSQSREVLEALTGEEEQEEEESDDIPF